MCTPFRHLNNGHLSCNSRRGGKSYIWESIQVGREISAIIVTDGYSYLYEQKIRTSSFLILIFNELFKFKTSDETLKDG